MWWKLNAPRLIPFRKTTISCLYSPLNYVSSMKYAVINGLVTNCVVESNLYEILLSKYMCLNYESWVYYWLYGFYANKWNVSKKENEQMTEMSH